MRHPGRERQPAAEAFPPELKETLFQVVQVLVEHGWPLSQIAAGMSQTAELARFLEHTGETPQ